MPIPRQQAFGTTMAEEGVSFRLWAPFHDSIQLKIEGEDDLTMHSPGGGWFELTTPVAKAGSLYQFVLPDGLLVPDPASRFQPQDAHGPSEVIDPKAYVWQDAAWRGRPWEETIVYELHLGTFTQEGTYRAAIERLDALVELGITALEFMPIADFPGARNWGYDGVLPFAPDSSYGRPEDLKALIDAAHARGLMVFLDVVYNHFGPDGNYLPAYAPIFKDVHTPWGAAINYDAAESENVREFIASNAAYWIEEFHFDGLRLDAVHAIEDKSATHLLEIIAARAREAGHGRTIHLIVENEENEASRLKRDSEGAPLQFTAQWNDDVHHVLHTAASGETAGYYSDYAGDVTKLGRALAEGFAFQGDMMEYRGSPRGEPCADLPPTAFVSFIQNHDQIGNRAFGERLNAIAPPEALRAIASIYLLLPQIPMLWMGEEWGASQPFPFFCNFEGDLSDAVREGRRAEFAKFPEFQNPEQRERIPDPTAESTFLSAKLHWDDIDRGAHGEWQRFYKDLIAVRHAEIIPRLEKSTSGRFDILGPSAVRVQWVLGDESTLTLHANLSAAAVAGSAVGEGRKLWSVGDVSDKAFGAWSVVWTLKSPGDR